MARAAARWGLVTCAICGLTARYFATRRDAFFEGRDTTEQRYYSPGAPLESWTPLTVISAIITNLDNDSGRSALS